MPNEVSLTARKISHHCTAGMFCRGAKIGRLLKACLAEGRSAETDRRGCIAGEVLCNGFIGGCQSGVLLPQALQGLHLLRHSLSKARTPTSCLTQSRVSQYTLCMSAGKQKKGGLPGYLSRQGISLGLQLCHIALPPFPAARRTGMSVHAPAKDDAVDAGPWYLH